MMNRLKLAFATTAHASLATPALAQDEPEEAVRAPNPEMDSLVADRQRYFTHTHP